MGVQRGKTGTWSQGKRMQAGGRSKTVLVRKGQSMKLVLKMGGRTRKQNRGSEERGVVNEKRRPGRSRRRDMDKSNREIIVK